MRGSDLFHVGIVVARLEPALAHFGSLLGLTWTPIREVPYPLRVDGDFAPGPVRYAFSTEAPHLELIEAIPGTIFALNRESNLHHLGWWVDDLAGESDRITIGGCPRDLEGLAPDAYTGQPFAYHRDDYAVRIELVDPSLRPRLERDWANPEPR